MSDTDLTKQLIGYIPSYVPLSPEEIAQRQARIAESVKLTEARNSKIRDVLARIGGDKQEYLSRKSYHVSYVVSDEVSIAIQGNVNAADMEDQVHLSPQEALALLSWLERERSTLEQLTRE